MIAMQRIAGVLDDVRANLPHGGGLPEAEWRRRHRAMVAVLWATAVVILPYSLAEGYGPGHTALHMGPIILTAILASLGSLGRRTRSALVALGLMTACAVFVHASHGLIEAHFSFFVFIVALTIYEDWIPFLVAVAFVLLHHGIYGMIDPGAVYDQPGQAAAPWKWAAIHAAFVAAAGLAAIVAWRFNEDVRRDIQQLASEKEELADQSVFRTAVPGTTISPSSSSAQSEAVFRSPLDCSTWTASRRSTTVAATRPATGC